MNVEWVREIRDQCRHARVPFFFKQWGGVQKSKNGRIYLLETYGFESGYTRDKAFWAR